MQRYDFEAQNLAQLHQILRSEHNRFVLLMSFVPRKRCRGIHSEKFHDAKINGDIFMAIERICTATPFPFH